MNESIYRGTKALLLIVLALGWIYLGAAGWARAELEEEIAVKSIQAQNSGPIVCDEIVFDSLADCLSYERDVTTNRIFPWVFWLPPFFGILIMAYAFGALGHLGRLLYLEIKKEDPFTTYELITGSIFGGIIGIMALAGAYLVPAALTVSGDTLRPVTLLFLTFFAGANAKYIFEWSESQVSHIFSTKNTSDSDDKSGNNPPPPDDQLPAKDSKDGGAP